MAFVARAQAEIAFDIVDDNGVDVGDVVFADPTGSSPDGIVAFDLDGFSETDLWRAVWTIDETTLEVVSLDLRAAQSDAPLVAALVCRPPTDGQCISHTLELSLEGVESRDLSCEQRDAGIACTGPAPTFAAVTLVSVDADGDGVFDAVDLCPGTAPLAITDATGCSIADLCPCDGDWKNHGAYVKCVSKTASAFAKQGLIGKAEKGAITSEAARSSCGKKSKK